VSLIEAALQKLRRAGEATPASRAMDARAPVAAPAGPAKRITIDFAALRNAGYLPQEGLERRFADHFRKIKRPLVEKALAGGADVHLILVSSALPGDGKTFISLNLALSMAQERDVSVLLVDADAPRAQVSEIFGIRGEPGLLDALTHESLDVESLIAHTDVRGFEILPAGRFVENATELLASARMSQIAARLGTRNPRRLVLFDTAPVLASSEGRAMLRLPGQIVLVARAGVTPRQALVDALTYVHRSKLQGLILNQAQFTSGAGYYEYPGHGAGDDETSGDV
jgi:exopolysaccharide/PEP-CTERM locus tyrosine autokinase